MAGIADEKYFWVRICNDGSHYDVDAVREADANGNPGEERKMIELIKLGMQMQQNGEFITEMQSVEIHIARVQTAEEYKAGINRKCVVNRRVVSC
jgi:hypothetical protein